MLRKSATIKGSYFSLRCKTSDFTQQNSRIKSFFLLSFLFQELEKLEVERIEWIQQHLRQYTTLRHETDMFNQSVSLFYLDLRSKHSRLRTTGTSPVLLDYRRRRMKNWSQQRFYWLKSQQNKKEWSVEWWEELASHNKSHLTSKALQKEESDKMILACKKTTTTSINLPRTWRQKDTLYTFRTCFTIFTFLSFLRLRVIRW